MLCALSDRSRDTTGIDPLFFELYQDELDSITARHAALAELVREHVTDYLKSRASGASGRKADASEPAALREVRDLRERLYTLVACGVHSSVKHDGETLEIIGKLGFAVTPNDREHGPSILPLVGLSVIALFVLSIVSSVWTRGFSEFLKLQVGSDWIGAFPAIPTSMPGYMTWTWVVAAFYFSAVFVALAIRNARIVRREWFDLDNLRRERPILRYIMPTLAGMAVGCFTLVLIAVAGGPGFKASFSELGNAIIQSLPWFPLAIVLPLIAIVLCDTPFEYRGFLRAALVRAMYGAIVMALVGVLTSGFSVSNGVESFAQDHQMAIPASVKQAGLYVSLFIASQIAVLVFVLCFVIQVADRYTSTAPRLAGEYIDVVTRQGPEFSIFFDNIGRGLPARFERERHRGHTRSMPGPVADVRGRDRRAVERRRGRAQGGRKLRADLLLRRLDDLRGLRRSVFRQSRFPCASALAERRTSRGGRHRPERASRSSGHDCAAGLSGTFDSSRTEQARNRNGVTHDITRPILHSGLPLSPHQVPHECGRGSPL